MTGYNGGRKNGVNVSQYIANLNKEPSAFEVARSEEQNYPVDDEGLAQFTNAEFFDFETGDFLNDANTVGGLDFDDGAKAEKQKSEGENTNNRLEFVNGNFPLEAVIPFEINSPVAQQSQQQQQAVYPNFTSQQTLPLPPFQPTSPSTSAAAAYPGYPPQPKQPQSTAAANQVSPSESADPARALAEEDKRRRNTAASARFRVKKKQREQALEQKTQELEKAKQALEQRVGQLETENEWLRGLVVEKNGGVGGGGPSSVKKTQKVSDSEANGAKKGVGTEA